MVNGLSINGLSINGLSINGLSINGLSINGLSINGLSINGTMLQGWESSGASLGAASLSRSELAVSSGWGSKKSNKEVVGLELPAQLTNGSTFKMRIDSATYESNIWQYGVSMRADNGTWIPLCGVNDTGPVLAIALQGRYDNTTGAYSSDKNMFTFACENGALGKCAVWGYKPWATKEECKSGDCETRPLQDWHLACTRMVRADYCGNGVPHTRDGTQINIWDVLGIQARARSTGWEMEAEWTPDGAECIRHTRWSQSDPNSSLSDLAYIQKNCPNRLAARSSRCDESRSNFNTRYGFDTDLDDRRLLRNESASN